MSISLEKSNSALDAHVREIVNWHFSPETGCPFWLEWAVKAGWNPRKEVQGLADLSKFGSVDGEGSMDEIFHRIEKVLS